MFEVVFIDETDSTNHWLQKHGGEKDMVVWTDYQTAGRGCDTNVWESERGQNLTLSMLIHPAKVPAADQFIISMANALALKRSLDDYVADIKIKWPNDIYWRNKKICGTLIEPTLQGSHIKDCIIGTGINVNQQQFVSNAPNPVSLRQILGHEVNREQVLQKVLHYTWEYLQLLEQGAWEQLRAAYRQALYRLDECHYYQIGDRRERCKLVGVTNDGHLQLVPSDGKSQETMPAEFAFKEVQFVI